MISSKRKIKNWLLRHPNFNPYTFSINSTYRTFTSSFRMLPNFIVLGFPNCGTASFYSYILQHPNMGLPVKKSIHFFNTEYERGLDWYKAQFPTIQHKNNFEKTKKENFIVGEDSPRSILFFSASKRMKKVLPKILLFVLLRNPIDRAYSSYQKNKNLGIEKLTFEELINEDEKRAENWLNLVNKNQITRYNITSIPKPYLSFGKYSYYLEHWFKDFPEEQFCFIKTSELGINIKDTMNEAFEFLHIPQFEIKNVEKKHVRKYEPMKTKTRDLLIDFFKPYNTNLEKLLNIKFDWN